MHIKPNTPLYNQILKAPKKVTRHSTNSSWGGDVIEPHLYIQNMEWAIRDGEKFTIKQLENGTYLVSFRDGSKYNVEL